ncbi:MAG: hypothetical protein HY209_00015 [Candidatus Omnitrophica bacterium]|nr:hypothetical protein [Candidatus Omnitrophota bacterium]
MKFFIMTGFVLLFGAGQVRAHEVSLIEEEAVKENIVTPQGEPSEEVEDDPQDDDFQQMNDFIQQENEKLKSIKLLNLDLERADLELKKKEIEQKIAQLNKSEGTLSASSQENTTDLKTSRPIIKLLSIFESKTMKQAMLSIDGVNINVKEGQQMDEMVVKSINLQTVIVEYEDGQTQELRLL